MFYRYIYAFIDRLKDMAPLKADDKLRTVLPQCLRDAALVWHSIELSDLDKDMLRVATLDMWHVALTRCFKSRTPVALLLFNQPNKVFRMLGMERILASLPKTSSSILRQPT